MNETVITALDADTNAIVPVRTAEKERRELIREVQMLSNRKRRFLRCLRENSWHVKNAYQDMIARFGELAKLSTVKRWMTEVDFYELVQRTRRADPAVREAVDGDRILTDHRQIADYNMEMVEVKNEKTGKITKRMRNASTALSALDKLGRNRRMWGQEEQTTRVVLDLVDLTGRPKEIDVTPEKPAIEGEVVKKHEWE